MTGQSEKQTARSVSRGKLVAALLPLSQPQHYPFGAGLECYDSHSHLILVDTFPQPRARSNSLGNNISGDLSGDNKFYDPSDLDN